MNSGVLYCFADNADEWNCSEHRCAVPMRALLAAGYRAEMMPIGDWGQGVIDARMGEFMVVVLQRNAFHMDEKIKQWRAAGVAVVLDLDDAYDLMTPANVAYPFWGLSVARGPDGQWFPLVPRPIDALRETAALCNGLTMPSKVLVEDWVDVAPAYYLPNYLDLSLFNGHSRLPHEGIWLGWGGSMSHLQSFSDSGIAGALVRLCHLRPQVKVIIQTSDGNVADYLNLPTAQKVQAPWVPYAQWPAQLAQWDLALAPLAGDYDDRRSHIKLQEYSALGIPWIASMSRAYAELEAYGALVENTPEAWLEAMLLMVDHLQDSQDVARGVAEPWAWGLGAEANAGNIMEVYKCIRQVGSHD